MRRVVVVESGSILEEGMEVMLAEEGDLQVSGISFLDDTTFLQDVTQLRPDVILLNEEGPLDSARILQLLEHLPTLATLRVIMVRPDDNTMHVFDRKQVVARRRDDLLSLIRSSGAPD